MMREKQMRLPNVRGQLFENILLADCTSWRVGGPARFLFKPADLEDLQTFLSDLPKQTPILWLGKGTNVLVRETGFNGVVILPDHLKQFYWKDEVLRIEAGLSGAFVTQQAIEKGFKGLEFLAGIPGTIGGALAMNAGAHGGEIWQHIIQVETINRSGKRFIRTPSDYAVGYREVRSLSVDEPEWFVAGHLKLEPGDRVESRQLMQQLLEKRRASQPLNLPNAGSVFRNPPGDYAARLIEACGLKGFKIGGAAVSSKHVNFIVNEGGATADDIERLIRYIMQQVKSHSGIELMPEVKIIG